MTPIAVVREALSSLLARPDSKWPCLPQQLEDPDAVAS